MLYVSGEESLQQTRMRADRLGVRSAAVHLFAETDADKVLAAAEALKPAALVIDSIQTMFLAELGSAPGTLSQVREVAGRLMAHAKRSGVPTFLVGHVTKDGSIAGPRVLEHMVDTVLYFEGERGHPFRILRAHKNRFGSTNEIGVFEMKGTGLEEVADPSALFLAERPAGKPGSTVTATLSGTRPLLVEVQALVAPTGYGTARRTAIGVDGNRVALLAAVLEKKEDVQLTGCDTFVNVAGGMTLSEPAADLAVCASLVSSLRNLAVPQDTLVLGEVGPGRRGPRGGPGGAAAGRGRRRWASPGRCFPGGARAGWRAGASSWSRWRRWARRSRRSFPAEGIRGQLEGSGIARRMASASASVSSNRLPKKCSKSIALEILPPAVGGEIDLDADDGRRPLRQLGTLALGEYADHRLWIAGLLPGACGPRRRRRSPQRGASASSCTRPSLASRSDASSARSSVSRRPISQPPYHRQPLPAPSRRPPGASARSSRLCWRRDRATRPIASAQENPTSNPASTSVG